MNSESSETLLNQLPPPPPGKAGWPWTEASDYVERTADEINSLPLISIITPSFNQGQFIEETIRSILLQNYPRLQYIIIDGGSTDETIDIIRKYKSRISYFISEADRGQSHAINKGIQMCKGNYLNWICSDDLLCRNAINSVASILASGNDLFLIGKGYRIDKNSKLIDAVEPSRITDFEQITNIGKYWRDGQSILQQSVFFPRILKENTIYLNENNHFSMDYELWGRLLMKKVIVKKTDLPIGMFRWYDGQKTSQNRIVTRSLIKAAKNLVIDNPDSGNCKKIVQLFKILEYKLWFNYSQFRSFVGIRRRLKKIING